MTVELVAPSLAHLASYVAALEADWSPDNVRGLVATREHLASIARDPADFLAGLSEEAPLGRTITLPDGAVVPRQWAFTRWIWDGAFCGSITFRWRPGGASLPEHVPGHIGFAVVPWKRAKGCATLALGLILPEARARGLDYVELTALEENVASRRVIEANGGTFVRRFEKSPHLGGGETLLYRISLAR